MADEIQAEQSENLGEKSNRGERHPLEGVGKALGTARKRVAGVLGSYRDIVARAPSDADLTLETSGIAALKAAHTRLDEETLIRMNGNEVPLQKNGRYFNLGEPLGMATFQRVHPDGRRIEPKTFPVYAEIAFQPSESAEKDKRSPLRAAIIGKPEAIHSSNATKEYGILVYQEGEDGVREVREKSFNVEKDSTRVYIPDADGMNSFFFQLTREGSRFFINPNRLLKGEWEAILPDQKIRTKVKNIKRRTIGEKYTDERDRFRRNSRRATLAGAALAAALMNGGPVNYFLNMHHDAGQYVQQLGKHDTNIYHNWKSVAETMEDLQHNDYSAIHERAVEYINTHKADFLPEQTATSSEHAVDIASNTKEVLDALNTVLVFYGKTGDVVTPAYAKDVQYALSITPYTEDQLNNLKYYAKTLIGTLQLLPKPLIQAMDFHRFLFASNMGNDGEEGCYFQGGADDNPANPENVIIFNIKNSLGDKVYNLIPGLGIPSNEMMDHELGHATQPPSTNDTSSILQSGNPVTIVKDAILQPLWGEPQYPSWYGGILGNQEEERAEDWRLVFSGQILDPGNPREFDSPANKGLLTDYADLAGRYGTGITDYLIDINTQQTGKDGNLSYYLLAFLALGALRKKIPQKEEIKVHEEV